MREVPSDVTDPEEPERKKQKPKNAPQSTMRTITKLALLLSTAAATAVVLFLLSFFVMDFAWTHFIVTDPKQISAADGVVVVGGGFLLSSFSGLTALILVLFRFWPRRASR